MKIDGKSINGGIGVGCGVNYDGKIVLCKICKAKLKQHEETKKAERERIWNILLKKWKFWEIDGDVIEELKKEIKNE